MMWTVFPVFHIGMAVHSRLTAMAMGRGCSGLQGSLRSGIKSSLEVIMENFKTKKLLSRNHTLILKRNIKLFSSTSTF